MSANREWRKRRSRRMAVALALAVGGLPAYAVPSASSSTAALPWCPSAPPITKWVSVAGGGNGSSPSSRLTLSQALSTANPGDVFGLAAGNYDSTGTRSVSRSGTSSAHVVFRAEDSANPPQIRYTGTSITPGSNFPFVFQVANGVHDVDFWHLWMNGGAGGGALNTWAGAGIRLGVGGTANNIHHIGAYCNRIWNMSSSGISTGVHDYLTAVGNLIWHYGYNPQWSWSSGISAWRTYFSDTAPGFHDVIVGNVIGGGFDAQNHTDGNAIIVDLQAVAGDNPAVLVANNVGYGNGGRCFQATSSENAWVVNNTCYRNQLDPSFTESEGIGIAGTNAGSQHWYNNAVQTINTAGHEAYYVSAVAQPTHVMAKNLAYGWSPPIFPSAWNTPDRLTFANPLFTSPPAISDTAAAIDTVAPWTLSDDAFVPGSNSPAIDGGLDPSTMPDATPTIATGLNQWLARDLFGSSRSGAFDLGAVEVTTQPSSPFVSDSFTDDSSGVFVSDSFS